MGEATEGTLHCSSEEVSSGNMETKGLAAQLNSSFTSPRRLTRALSFLQF